MDVLVVADRQDALAGLFAAEVRRRGKTPVILGRSDAARLFTIAGDEGASRVEPDVPILLRPNPPPRPGRDADEQFLTGECLATLWAACVLTAAPVVNRPTSTGFEARWSGSGAVTERRAAADMAPELYGRTRTGDRPPDDRPWAIEDSRGRTRRWTGPDIGDGPFRARPLLADELYERVVVLQPQAWRTSTVDLCGFGLEQRSREIAAAIGLAFAVVTWGVAPDLGAVRLARVDPYPRADHVLPVWHDCLPALLEHLQC
jgi:hypothetical protein